MARSAGYREALEQAGQLTLFACFDAPADDCAEVTAPAELLHASNDDEGDDDPLILAPVVHRVISASEAEPLNITGISSVFDLHLARSPVTPPRRQTQGQSALYRVTRADGVTRCVRIQVQDTQEWREREAARRARQRPPKPTEKAKTRSKKLAELVGV